MGITWVQVPTFPGSFLVIILLAKGTRHAPEDILQYLSPVTLLYYLLLVLCFLWLLNITPSSLDSASVLPFLSSFYSDSIHNNRTTIALPPYLHLTIYSSAPTDTCLSSDSQKHCFLLHLARIYFYEIFNIYVEIKLILGL